MAPMPPLGGLADGAPRPTRSSSAPTLVLRGLLSVSSCGRFLTWNNRDEADGTGDPAEDEVQRKTQRSISECYFAVKGTALVLPHDESMHCYRCTNNNVVAGDIRKHLQSMLYMLRREDTLKMAVKLESAHPSGRTRYLVVVSRPGPQGTEEACLLGIDCNHRTTIGLVIPVWADARITLDGDGGFSMTSSSGHYIFKPVSVQAMWSALQSLHKACAKARESNYFQGGGTHLWVQYYADRIKSEQSCLNEWHAMDDLVSKRPPTPDYDRSKPKEKVETKALIRSKLKELMMTVDLDEVTSKFIRSRLEEELNTNLNEFKSFIDQEMLTILGQMDAATEILEYLYLGSEWNASNLDELKDKGVGHILNVTREIDNFYPGLFDYFNIRVYDDETTEMLKHWDRTYKYIAQAKERGSKVLVHCKMGISRSASVVIAYVMKAYDLDLEQALEFVKTRRSCIKPNSGFLKQLETYQGILNASKQRHNSIWRSKSLTNLKYEKPKRSKKQDDETDGRNNQESLSGNMGLLVPGSMSRPKSWSPDDAASEVFFSTSKRDLPSSPISPCKERPSRKRVGRPRHSTDPIRYASAFTDAAENNHSVTDDELSAKVKPLPLFPTLPVEDPGLRRIASVKDRICELESQTVVSTKPGKAPTTKIDVPRSSKPCCGKNGLAEEESVALFVDVPNIAPFELRGADPVASQTKPSVSKHIAVVVKPVPPWMVGGCGDGEGEETEALVEAPPERESFILPARSNTDDTCERIPTCQGPTSDLSAFQSANTSHTNVGDHSVEWTTSREDVTKVAAFPAEICKLQVGFAAEESNSAEPRRENVVVLPPVLSELQVDGRRTEERHEKSPTPLLRAKLGDVRQRQEERGFARSLRFEGGAFPSQTRSTPSTPPEAGPPSRQILRSQSLRCESRPKSLALPKYVAWSPPRPEGRSFPSEMSHSASTPSVVESLNAVHPIISVGVSPPSSAEVRDPALPQSSHGSDPGSEQPLSFPDTSQLPWECPVNDVPVAGIVKQQRAVLEGLRPVERKPPVADSSWARKDQARLIRELGSSLVPGDDPEDDDSAKGVVRRLTQELEAKARHGGRPVADRLVLVERCEPPTNTFADGGSSSTPNSPLCERGSPAMRGCRAFSEGRPLDPPPTPGRQSSLDAERLRRLSATRDLSALLAQHCVGGLASQAESPPLPPKGHPPFPAMPPPGVPLPGGLQRKVRKQQGRTHPLSNLAAARQRHANPLYNTM